MDCTKSISNKLYSLLQPAVDYTTFIGSGIFASTYSTIWINDPTSKSGIVLAGALNATALGIANYLTTDKETPLLKKIVITLVSLAITAFSTPYLAVALKDRFAIILTPQVAYQIAGLNLVAKTTTYILTTLVAYLTKPITLEEIKHLSVANLQQKHQFFQTDKGKVNWQNESEENQLAYLNSFIQNNLPFIPFDKAILCKLDLSTDPANIRQYTSNQAIWIYNIICNSSDTPSFVGGHLDEILIKQRLFARQLADQFLANVDFL